MALIEKHGHGGDLLTAGQLFKKDSTQFLDFSANINPLGPPPGLIELLKDRLDTIVHYPDPTHRVLRQKLAIKHAVSPEHILIGNGGAECISLAILGLQPQTVGVILPSFSEYMLFAASYGARIKSCYGKPENQFKPEISELLQLIAETDLAFIGQPNNPNGVMYSKEELIQMAEQAEKSNTFLVIDEAFIDFLPLPKQLTLLQELAIFNQVIIIRSMTKFYAIPGLRLGYALSGPSLISKMKDKQVTWSVNQMALAAGEACLEAGQYEMETIRLIEEERSYVKQFIEENLGWQVFPGQANFLLIRLSEGMTSAELQRRMGQKGILIRSCSMYPGLTNRDFRIAIRTKKENDCLIQAFKEVVEERNKS